MDLPNGGTFKEMKVMVTHAVFIILFYTYWSGAD